MEWASNIISEIYRYLRRRDDTGIDRLNRLYTVALLSAFVTLISSQQYIVGDRIICWMPNEFSRAHGTYTTDICWLGHRNYYVPENTTLLHHPGSPRTYPFAIYPWLPIILIGMTVSFILPYLIIWHGLSTRSGIDIKRLVQIDNREILSRSIHFVLHKQYSMNRTGGFYTATYLLMKIVYIFILTIQIIFINKLLLGEYFKTSMKQALTILSVKYNMWSSPQLPIETMCDFMIRMLGQNNNWYTVQCILPFNLFTKRIFALLALWFFLLLILNIIDLIFFWVWRRLWLRSYRYEYVSYLLNIDETHLQKNENKQWPISKRPIQSIRKEFVDDYLKIDGYLLLKLLHANSSDIDMGHLIGYLYKQFLEVNMMQQSTAHMPCRGSTSL